MDDTISQIFFGNNENSVIDTLGPNEFDNELSIIESGGRLRSLRTGPNKRFEKGINPPLWKQKLISLTGARYDHKAMKQDVEYHFILARSDGTQLREITKIIEGNNIIPPIHPTLFTIDNINKALELVENERPKGNVIINFQGGT